MAGLELIQFSALPRLRETLGHSAKEHYAYRQGTGCDCPGTIRHGQNRHLLHLHPAEPGHHAAGDAGSVPVAHSRVGCANPESHSCPRRHDECPVPCVHRWHQPGRGYPQVGLRSTHCERHSRTSLRHDQATSAANKVCFIVPDQTIL